MGCGCSKKKVSPEAMTASMNARDMKMRDRNLSRRIAQTVEERLNAIRIENPDLFQLVTYHNYGKSEYALSFAGGLFNYNLRHYTSNRFIGDREIWMLKADIEKAPKNKITVFVDEEIKLNTLPDATDNSTDVLPEISDPIAIIVEDKNEEPVKSDKVDIELSDISIVKDVKPKRKYTRRKKKIE